MIGPIRDRRVFDSLRSSGRSLRRGPLTVRYVPLEDRQEGPLLAFAIGRRFGPAVVRNRARRRVREAFRSAAGSTSRPLPYALLVQARPAVLERPFAALVADATSLLDALPHPADRP